MAAWFEGMISPKDVFRPGKIGLAQNWWVGGLLFYVASGLLAIYAALTEQGLANSGFAAIESMLLLLLLFETLTFGVTKHLPMEAPTVGEVVASCACGWPCGCGSRSPSCAPSWSARWGRWHPRNGCRTIAPPSSPRSRRSRCYVAWRILKYRMDRYIADNPLPSAGFAGDADDDAPAAASRLRTIMPVLRVTSGVTFLIVGGLLVLSAARREHHAADRRRVGAGTCRVVRQPVAGARHRLGRVLPRRGFVPRRRVHRRQQGQGHGRGLLGALDPAAPPERSAPHRAVRPAHPHHQLQPRLDDGEVQPVVRASTPTSSCCARR